MQAFGFNGLNVPARRYDEDAEKDGMWVACEDEPDTGTMWIQYDIYSGEVDDQTLEAYAQPLRIRGAVQRPIAQKSRRLFHVIESARENGVMLRFNRWILLERRGSEIALLQFTLVLGLDQEKSPEFVTLAKAMEREIANATLGAFPINGDASSSP